VVGAFLVGILFLAGLAAKERDDRFCVACHLHEEKFRRLNAPASTDLAGFHHAKAPTVGCIGCHGGSDLPMRLAVWGVAGVDTVRFLVGAYREPTGLRLPLRDAECRQCHAPILKTAAGAAAGSGANLEAESETEGHAGTSYHAIRDHDGVRVTCIRCHAAHTTDSEASQRFIARPRVVPICRECHRAM
jgi:hypothetical protein